MPRHDKQKKWKIPRPSHEGRGIKNKNYGFYNSKVWRQLSTRYAKSVGYLCEQCKKEGNITDTSYDYRNKKRRGVTDHIIPINQDQTKKLEWDNLQRLCESHHNQKSGRENKLK